MSKIRCLEAKFNANRVPRSSGTENGDKFERLAKVLGVENAEKHMIPYRTIGLLALGDALRKTGFLRDAVQSYRDAVELDPGFQGAAVALSFALRELGEREESAGVVAASFDANTPIGRDSWTVYLMGESVRHLELWRGLRARMK